MQDREGWEYWVLGIFTYPAGLLFTFLNTEAHKLIFGNPVNMLGPHWRSDVYSIIRNIIFVGGGTLWFFGIGFCLRWVMQKIGIKNIKTKNL